MSRHYYDEAKRPTGHTDSEQYLHLYPEPDAFTYSYGDPYSEFLEERGLGGIVTASPCGPARVVTTLAPGEPDSPPSTGSPAPAQASTNSPE